MTTSLIIHLFTVCLQALFLIFLPYITFLDTMYNINLDFCACMQYSGTYPAQGQTEQTADAVQQPYSRFAEGQFIDDHTKQAAHGTVCAENALGARAGIAQEHERHTEHPQNVFRRRRKCRMPDAAPQQPEQVKQDARRNTEQRRPAEQCKFLLGRPEGVGNGMRRHRKSLPSAPSGESLSLSP